MTRALPMGEKVNAVQQSLLALAFRRRMVRFIAGLIRVAWLVLLLALAMVLLDAVVNLPQSVRVGAVIGWLVFGVLGVLRAIPWRAESDQEILYNARRIERANRLRNNAIINAIFLSHAAQKETNALTRELANRSIERGHRTMDQVKTDAIVQREHIGIELNWLWLAVVLWLVTGLIQPRLLGIGALRMMNPLGTVLPFSLTELDVHITPENILVGDDAMVQVDVTGRLPQEVEFVEVDEAGNERNRWPMSEIDVVQAGSADTSDTAETRSTPDASYAKKLHNLTQTMHFRIEADGAQSQVYSIEPGQRAQDNGDSAEGPQPDAQDSGSMMDESQASAESSAPPPQPDDSLREKMPAFFEKLDQLAQQAFELREQSEALMESMPADLNTPEGEQWLKEMDELQEKLHNFQEQANQLAHEARKLGEQFPEHRQTMEQIAQQLESLGMCALGQCPNPGDGPPSPLPVPGQGVGKGPGSGAGGGGQMAAGGMGYWLMGVQQMSAADGLALEEMMQMLAEGLSQETDEGDNPLAPWPEGSAIGRYVEKLQQLQQDPNQPDAVMQQVPAEYRTLFGEYLRRVAEDERESRP